MSKMNTYTCNVKHIRGSEAESLCPVHGNKGGRKTKSSAQSTASTVVMPGSVRANQEGPSHIPVVVEGEWLVSSDGRDYKTLDQYIYTDQAQAERISERELSAARVQWYLDHVQMSAPVKEEMELALSYVSTDGITGNGDDGLSDQQKALKNTIEKKFGPHISWSEADEEDGHQHAIIATPLSGEDRNLHPSRTLDLSTNIGVVAFNSIAMSGQETTSFSGLPPWLKFDQDEGEFKVVNPREELLEDQTINQEDNDWKEMVSETLYEFEVEHGIVVYNHDDL